MNQPYVFIYLNGDPCEKPVKIFFNKGDSVCHKLYQLDGEILHLYNKINKAVIITKNKKTFTTFLSSLKSCEKQDAPAQRVGTWLYDYHKANNRPTWIDLQPGDLVRCKKEGSIALLGKCYPKLNLCYIEHEDGNLYRFRITDLEKIKEF